MHFLLAALLSVTALAIIPPSTTVSANGESPVELGYFYIPPTDGTSVSTLARETSFIVLTNQNGYRNNLRSAGFDGPILNYRMVLEVEGPGIYKNSSSSCARTKSFFGNQLARDAADFCDNIHPNEGWFLHNGAGDRLVASWGSRYYYLMNPASSGWRQFVRQRLDPVGTKDGWDGIFYENIPLSLVRHRSQNLTADGTVNEFGSESSFRQQVANFLGNIAPTVRHNGGMAVANVVSDRNTGDYWNMYLDQLDGGMYEAWGTGYGSGHNVQQWENNLIQAENALAKGKMLMLAGRGTKNDHTLQTFALASYLLITDGNKARFRWADNSAYSSFWQYDNYDSALGEPTGNRYQVGSEWRRDFQCGYVTVDPEDRTGHIVEQSCGDAPPSNPDVPDSFELPGTIQAADYKTGGQNVGYYDSTSGNTGGAYRNDDVDIQECIDPEASGTCYNVGWTTPGEWLAYDVNLQQSGDYQFTFRIATTDNDRSLRIELDGVDITGSVSLPNSGGWQEWTDVTTEPISLGSGAHELRVVSETGSYNIRSITAAAEGSSDQPWNQRFSITSQIEAENYKSGGQNVGYYDTTSGNTGGAYRNDDVDIQECSDPASSGTCYNVGWTTSGEWLAYDVSIPESGEYSFNFRVASPQSDRSLHLRLNGSDISGSVTIPNTGGWQDWTTVTTGPIQLQSGNYELRLVSDTGSFNVNHFSATRDGFSLPGTIQAEDYNEGGQNVGYYDTTSGNTGGEYRDDDVDIEACSDPASGSPCYNIGYVDQGEWLAYGVDVQAAGSYDITFRTATPMDGRTLRLEMGGVNVTGSVTLPNTGGWQSWTDVTIENIHLDSGSNQMRLFAETNGFNINYIRIDPA